MRARVSLVVVLFLPALLHGQTTPLAVVSAATYQADGPVAPDMLASGFTAAIPNLSLVSARRGLPTELAGFSLSVRDSAGVERAAGLIGVFPGQINFVVPGETAGGSAIVSLRMGGTVVASGTVRVGRVAPGLFTANSSGRGAPAGLALVVAADGARRTEELFEWNSSGNAFAPRPFDLTGEGRQVFLMLFGTGIRGSSGGVVATVATEPVPVLAATAQGSFAGLDQVNLGPLPRSLAGRRGTVEVALIVDNVPANRVTIAPTLPASGEWGRRAELPQPNSEIAVAELDDRVYVIGGYPSNRITVATVQVYDTSSDTWSLLAPLPTPLNHAMAAGVNGKLYVIGGQTTSDGAGNFVDTVYEYDPVTVGWTRRTSMPTARGAGAAAVIGDKIYVAGGRPPRGADFAVYDTRANTWATLPNLPTQRNHLAAAAIGGKVYVAGGRFEGGFQSPQTDAVEVFDPATNTWTARARLPIPRGGVNGLEAMGCLHVFGGEGNSNAPSGVYPDHDVYNPVTNTWTRLGPMPVPVHGVTGAAFVDGLIYLPGGGTAEGGSSGSRWHQIYRPAVACR